MCCLKYVSQHSDHAYMCKFWKKNFYLGLEMKKNKILNFFMV
jgi:hypothetical protein